MLFFIVSSSLLFVIIGLLFYRSTNEAIRASKNSEMATIANETSNKIERFMFERYGDIQVMADSPLLRGENIQRQLKADYLESVRHAYKTYDFILTVDAEGKIDIISGELKNDKTYEAYIKNVLKGEIFVSDFITDQGKNEVEVYFGAPIKNLQGRIIGAAIARMNFNAIAEIVTKVKVGKSGKAFLLGKDGGFIFKPKEFKGSMKLELPKENNYSITKSVLSKGDRFIYVMYPVKKYTTQNKLWYLALEEPYNEAYKVGISLRNYTILLILVGVISLFILGTILSTIITKPIKKLVEETKAVVKNNNPSEGREGRDEIGHLSASFNVMMNSLKELMQQILEISGEAASLDDIRQYTETFFERLPSAIIAIDSSGVITSFNEAAEVITGIEKQQIIGLTMELLKDEGIAAIMEGLKLALKYNKTVKRQIIKVKNGEFVDTPIMLTTTIQKDGADNIIGIIGVFKMVEEINRFEAGIIRARNLASLGTLSAGMAHEIKNPLTSIKGYAQYVREELGDNNELSEDMSIIIHEVDRLDGILERFLKFAKPGNLKLKPTDINKLIENIVKLISREIAGSEIAIVQSLQQIPMIEADEEQLEQAFLNITINSVQAMEKNGELSISTLISEDNEFIHLSIKDNGTGIRIEDLDKIFDPFYTTKEKGTGLGLAISTQIIEKHRGFIEVESTIGKGTEFIIGLPVKK